MFKPGDRVERLPGREVTGINQGVLLRRSPYDGDNRWLVEREGYDFYISWAEHNMRVIQPKARCWG